MRYIYIIAIFMPFMFLGQGDAKVSSWDEKIENSYLVTYTATIDAPFGLTFLYFGKKIGFYATARFNRDFQGYSDFTSSLDYKSVRDLSNVSFEKYLSDSVLKIDGGFSFRGFKNSFFSIGVGVQNIDYHNAYKDGDEILGNKGLFYTNSEKESENIFFGSIRGHYILPFNIVCQTGVDYSMRDANLLLGIGYLF